MTSFTRCRRAVLGIAAFIASTPLYAVDAYWITSADTFFDNTFVWQDFHVPGETDRPVFAAPHSGSTVSLTRSVLTAGVLVSGSSVTLDMQGWSYSIDGALDVTNAGSLTWRNGLVLGGADTYIGGGASLSSMTAGAGATMILPAVYVGRNGPGLLRLQGGNLQASLVQAGYWGSNEGRVVVDGSQATVERTYLGGSEVCSPFCNVGVGPGKLEVINGGRYTTQVLSLGKNGNAEVKVNTQGILNATDITMSQLGTATITVDGGTLRGNALTLEAATTPVAGSGLIEIKGGGNVELNSLTLGPGSYVPNSTINGDRRLQVSGANTQLVVHGPLMVRGGGGRMTIADGALVKSDSALIVGSRNVAAEAIVSNGGLWQNTGAIEIGKFLESGSRLTIDGGRVETGSMYFIASTACVPFCNVVPRSDLVVRNGGSLNAGAFFGGRLGPGAIRVESGSSVHTSTLDLGGGFNAFETFVTGPGSTWINDGATNLGVSGAQSNATVLLQVDNLGLFKTGGVLNATNLATVRVVDGTLDVGGFGNFAGALDFQSGHVITRSNFAIQPGAPLGTNLVLQSNRALSVLATTTIALGQSLTVNGGRFATHSLQNLGTFSFVSGVFAMTSDPLAIGPGGILGSTVALTDSRRLEVTNQLDIASNGIVNVSGDALAAGTVSNLGQVQLNGGVARITTPNFANGGRLVGSGAVLGNVTNDKQGQIRVVSGQELDVSGNLNNDGQVFVLGGTLQVGETLDNSQNGSVSGRGVLVAGKIRNVGSMAFSGTTDLIGDVQNEKDGSIIISGGSTLTFYDDLVHNGAEIRASEGNRAVFFGSVRGEGRYTGGGDFYFEGTLSPGNSPAVMSVAGNATLGPDPLEIEIAGLLQGSQYDAVHVSGSLTLLGGTLDVLFLDGFSAAAGDSFDILDFASLSGQFSALNLAALSNGLVWNTSQLYSTGVLSVQAVPEPGTYVLMLAGLLLLLRRGLISRARR